MTAEPDDEILDSLFHGCALAAFLDQAEAEQGWPSSENTRQRAYQYYETALVAKNHREDYPPPACGINACAKPDVRLICSDCSEELETEQPKIFP